MPQDIYQILQSIMEERSLSIAETARICDLPDSTVRGIISRKQKSVALEVAFKLSKGLHVSLEVLNGEQSKETPLPAKPENGDLSKEEILKLLRDVVVKLGWCQPDAPLTNKQVDLLKAIVILIEAGYPPQS